MVYIYALELESGKYYIGKTSNPKFRLNSHFNQYGSSWTKKYKPINIHQIIPDCDDFDEDKYTLKYMKKYGINNVRGGSFCQLKLTDENRKTIEKMIKGSSDKCYKCGGHGHYASNCKYECLEESEDEETLEEESEEDYYIDNLIKVFRELKKENGIYKLDKITYLWYKNKLYEKTKKKNTKIFTKNI